VLAANGVAATMTGGLFGGREGVETAGEEDRYGSREETLPPLDGCPSARAR
jgi:hypothetical protein